MGSGSLYWLLGVTEEISTALSFCGCVFITSSPFIWNQMLIYQDLSDAWPRDKAHYFSFLPTGCFKGSLYHWLYRVQYFILTLKILHFFCLVFFRMFEIIWPFELFENAKFSKHFTCELKVVVHNLVQCQAKGRAKEWPVRNNGGPKPSAKWWWKHGNGFLLDRLAWFFLVPDERYCWWKISRNHHLTCKPCKWWDIEYVVCFLWIGICSTQLHRQVPDLEH